MNTVNPSDKDVVCNLGDKNQLLEYLNKTRLRLQSYPFLSFACIYLYESSC
jgi:hypothetical protein